MNDDTRTLYVACACAGLQPVGVFALGADRYIIIAPPAGVWLSPLPLVAPDIPGLRFLRAAPVLSYELLDDGRTWETINQGVALWYIDSSMAYPDGTL